MREFHEPPLSPTSIHKVEASHSLASGSPSCRLSRIAHLVKNPWLCHECPPSRDSLQAQRLAEPWDPSPEAPEAPAAEPGKGDRLQWDLLAWDLLGSFGEPPLPAVLSSPAGWEKGLGLGALLYTSFRTNLLK